MRLSQWAQPLASLEPARFRDRCVSRQAFDLAPGLFERVMRSLRGVERSLPFQMRDEGVKRVDFFAQGLVFARFAGLAFEAFKLAFDLGGDFAQAFKIGLCSAQFQFGLVAAGIEPANAGSLLKDPPSVLRLGRDQFGNLPLAHQ